MGKREARVLAVAVTLAGFVVTAFGVAARPPKVRESAQAFFNFDRPGLNSHNSPAVAADPARPDTVAVVDRIDTPLFSCSVSVSSDLGTNWSPVQVPLPEGAPNCFWPDVGWDDEGKLVVLYTSTGGPNNLPVGVWLQRFDGSTPEGPAVRVAGSEAYHAHMAVQGSAVLVAYVQAQPENAAQGFGFTAGPNPIMAVRSADGGRTFSAPITVSEPGRRVALPNVVLGPNGEGLVAALDLGDDVADYEGVNEDRGGPPDDHRWAIVAYRTANGGAKFSRAVSVARNLVIPQRIIVNLGPVPGLARDPKSGRLYVAWDSGRGDARDVFVATSGDDGASWTAPIAVVEREGTQTLPGLDVAADGRLDVVFYDRSKDPEDRKTEVVVASSWDQGLTFWPATVSGRDFDSRLGYGAFQGIPVLSGQLAVLSAHGKALAFWADTRRATRDDNAVELALAVVDTKESGGRRWPVAAAGLLIFGGGVRVLARKKQ